MQPSTPSVLTSLNAYFDLMYDADDARFSAVFHDLCTIHGLRNGELVSWSASEFRDLMRNRPSPASMESPRQQAILRVDESLPDIATANVRVRIGQTCFLDHLILHRIDGKWLVTAKGFHIERTLPPGS